jgi:hypothetical protein
LYMIHVYKCTLLLQSCKKSKNKRSFNICPSIKAKIIDY